VYKSSFSNLVVGYDIKKIGSARVGYYTCVYLILVVIFVAGASAPASAIMTDDTFFMIALV